MIVYISHLGLFGDFDSTEAMEMYALAESLVGPEAATVALPEWASEYLDTIPGHMHLLAKGSLLPMVIYRSLLRVNPSWIPFLWGHWQEEMPQQEGEYRVRTKQKEDAGSVFIYRDPRDGALHSTKDWKGDWWSDPLPLLPELKK